jgi:hypothetical protein
MGNSKMEKLLEQKKAIDARIRLEQSKENGKKRKQETRRKILAGAAVLDEASKHPKYKTELYKLLESFLKRDDDRALFELKPLAENEAHKAGEKTDKAEISGVSDG